MKVRVSSLDLGSEGGLGSKRMLGLLCKPTSAASSGRQARLWHQKTRPGGWGNYSSQSAVLPAQGRREGLRSSSGKPFSPSCSCSSCAPRRTSRQGLRRLGENRDLPGVRTQLPPHRLPDGREQARPPGAPPRAPSCTLSMQTVTACLSVHVYTLRGTHPHSQAHMPGHVCVPGHAHSQAHTPPPGRTSESH